MKLWPTDYVNLDTGATSQWREKLKPANVLLGATLSVTLIVLYHLISSKPAGLSPSIPASPAHYLPIKSIPDASEELLDPLFSSQDGLLYPPDLQPAKLNKYKRASATFVSLVRNSELEGMMSSMREIESSFNKKAEYPWVFLNEEEFTQEFKDSVRRMTRSQISFGKVPKEHWSYPSWIDQNKAAETRQRMKEQGVFYGDSESYRHMCRFNSG